MWKPFEIHLECRERINAEYKFIPSGDNDQIEFWSKQRHENCIESTEIPVKKDLSTISEVIESS